MIDQLISSALECQRNKHSINHTNKTDDGNKERQIICAADISDGKQVTWNKSHFLSLTLSLQLWQTLHK